MNKENNKKLKKTNKRNRDNIVAMATCDCQDACACGWDYSAYSGIYEDKYHNIQKQAQKW